MDQQEVWNHAFPGDKSKHLWRLYINSDDVRDQDPDTARLTYDRDRNPGYAKGMDRAYNFIRETLFAPLTPDWYRDLHDHAVDAVLEPDPAMRPWDGPRESKPMLKGYRHGCHYPLGVALSTVSDELGAEWKSEKFILYDRNVEPKWGSFAAYTDHGLHLDDFLAGILPCQPGNLNWDNKQVQVHSSFANNPQYYPETVQQSMDKVAGIFARYASDRAAARTPDEIRRACCRCALALTIHHNLPGGNYRTGKSTLDKLLIENRQPPTILPNPIVLGGAYTVDQLSAIVAAGQRAFTELPA